MESSPPGISINKATDIIVAVFADHREAGPAIVRLIDVGFGTASISIVGRGFPRRVPGATSDRTVPVRHGGNRSTFWSEMESTLFESKLVSLIPPEPIVALGYLAKRAPGLVESAGASTTPLGAALSGIGIPGEHVVRYEFAVHANGCLVMAHGDGLDIARARTVFRFATPASVDVHAVANASRSGAVGPSDRVLSEAPARLR